MIKRCLNIGCGRKKIRKEGECWINADIEEIFNPDLIYDFNNTRWKIFKDDFFDEIYIAHCLEHLSIDLYNFLKECERILKINGKLIIIVPHSSAAGYFSYFHKKHFWLNSFDQDGNNITDAQKIRILKYIKLKLISKTIKFYEFKSINKLIELIINNTDKMKSIYEHSFLRFLIPAKEYKFVLQKI